MSIGLLVDEREALVWRGPMIHSAVQQFLRDVMWGPLDYLVFDMPPGTGDAQLSLSQVIPLGGVVMVTTPQDVALLDVRKALAMFRKLNVPILGIVENMSYFVAPDTGARYAIFGEGGGEKVAGEFDVPLRARQAHGRGRPQAGLRGLLRGQAARLRCCRGRPHPALGQAGQQPLQHPPQGRGARTHRSRDSRRHPLPC